MRLEDPRAFIDALIGRLYSKEEAVKKINDFLADVRDGYYFFEDFVIEGEKELLKLIPEDENHGTAQNK